MRIARATDPQLQRFLDGAASYAVLPAVHYQQDGEVFDGGQHVERGQLTGYCYLPEIDTRLSTRGQSTELVFFENPALHNRLKKQDCAFAAQDSTASLMPGASASAGNVDGVAVLILREAGLLVEVALGWQELRYEPMQQACGE